MGLATERPEFYTSVEVWLTDKGVLVTSYPKSGGSYSYTACWVTKPRGREEKNHPVNVGAS